MRSKEAPNDEVLTEFLMETKKREIEISLSQLADNNDIILWSKNKLQSSFRSLRGSRFRGVSRNGKKW